MSAYFGVYRGICVNDEDPQGRARIQVQVPMLTGTATTNWVDPCVPPGWRDGLLKKLKGHETHLVDGVAVGHTDNHAAHSLLQSAPKPGDGVWIMYEAGDIEHPVWLGVWL